MWWEKHRMLIVSDVHIGKAAHFRKHGIAIPTDINRENLWNLAGLLLDYKPDTLLLLGDLVHSVHNSEWDAFADMRANFSATRCILVRGNHDVMPETVFNEARIDCVSGYRLDGFHFTHEPLEITDIGEHEYNICGHLHPAIRLKGAGKQSLKLSCYWFAEKQAVLPAFGAFTGTHVVRTKATDEVFVIADDKVLKV